MTNHGFYVVISSTAFQRTIKELKWENPQLAMKRKVSICCLNYAFPGLTPQWQETVWTRPVPEQVIQSSNKARVWYYRPKLSKLLFHPIGFRKVDTERVFQQCWINVFRRGGNQDMIQLMEVCKQRHQAQVCLNQCVSSTRVALEGGEKC